MLKIKQSNTSSTYKSDVGTKIFYGTRLENDKQVTTLSATVEQNDDLATSAQEGTDFVIALKVYHTDGSVVSAASIAEALHYITTYGTGAIADLLAGPIENSALADKI